MDENRFNERLKETEEAYGQMVSHLEWLKERDDFKISEIGSGMVANMMALAHLRSTLRYINGEIDDLLEQVNKDTFTTMYNLGMMKEDSLKYAISNGYLDLPPKAIESLLVSQAHKV